MIYEHTVSGERYYVSEITEVDRNGHKFQYVMTHVSGDGVDHYNDTETITRDYTCIDTTALETQNRYMFRRLHTRQHECNGGKTPTITMTSSEIIKSLKDSEMHVGRTEFIDWLKKTYPDEGEHIALVAVLEQREMNEVLHCLDKLPKKYERAFVLFKCKIAAGVLPNFEHRPRGNKKDLRPRRAIEAARAWAFDPTPDNKEKMHIAMKEAVKAKYDAERAVERAYEKADLVEYERRGLEIETPEIHYADIAAHTSCRLACAANHAACAATLGDIFSIILAADASHEASLAGCYSYFMRMRASHNRLMDNTHEFSQFLKLNGEYATVVVED